MAQLPLFDQGPHVLLDDASGRIVLAPAVVSPTLSASWFTSLRDGVPWKEGRRQMYEREVNVPRLRAHYQLDDPSLPAALRDALAAVHTVVDAPFDSVGLNLYRDHRDSVAPHNDKLDELQRGQPIALLSLGATRRMVIRAKQPPRRMLQLDLEAGSVLVMSWETQRHYDHGIPKQRAFCEPRISLAFRVRGQRGRGSASER